MTKRGQNGAQQIPWVITLGQKTLGPYYKYIVKDSPKTLFHSLMVRMCHFSLRYTTYFPAIISLATPFPMLYVDISPFPLWIHPPFDNYPWRRLENHPWTCGTTYEDGYDGPSCWRKACLFFVSSIS